MSKALSYDLIPLEKPLLDSRLASCPLRTFIAFYRFHGLSWIAGCPAGWLAGWVTELVGLLWLLGLLEGLIGFLASLDGGLKDGVPHARRSERSADQQTIEDTRILINHDVDL